MAENRTVTLHFNAVDQTEMRQLTDATEWYYAIGYLSTWNMTFTRVNIYRDTDTDLLAVYYDDKDVRQYTIAAVWHNDHYGFHS